MAGISPLAASMPPSERLAYAGAAAAAVVPLAVAGGVLFRTRARGVVGTRHQLLAMASPHQTAFALRNLHRPWLLRQAHAIASEAHATTALHFGRGEHIDDAGDAFRHAYAVARLKQTAMQHRMSEPRATRLALAAGRAHELDGVQNARGLSMQMDLLNNIAGARLLGHGRDTTGAWLDREQLAARVLAAMRAGELQVFDGPAALRASTTADVPAPPAGVMP